MQTTTAETLVPECPATVHAAVLALAARLWGVGPDDIVTSTEGASLVHGVRLDEETNCWLTWQFATAGPSLTRVHLSHDDTTIGDDAPDPELDAVLGMLLATFMHQPSAAEQARKGTS